MSVLKAAENWKSQKTCGNRKMKKNVAENRKKLFFSAESRSRTPYYPPSFQNWLELYREKCIVALYQILDCSQVKSQDIEYS